MNQNVNLTIIFRVVLCLSILYSCNRINTTHNITTIRTGSLDAKTIRTSSFVSEVKIVPLVMTDPACFIAQVTKLLLTDSYIFVFDQYQMTIFIFSPEGKLLNQINCQGKGPGEYVKISNFTYDSIKNRIHIFDQNQYKVLQYSVPDAKFIASIPMNFVIDDFVLAGSSYYCFSPHEINFTNQDEREIGYGLFEVNDHGKFTRMVLGIGGDNREIFGARGIQCFCTNKNISILPFFCDTIYGLNEQNNFTPQYCIDFGPQSMPNSIRHRDYSSPNENLESLMNSNYVNGKLFFQDGDDFIYFMGIVKEQGYCVLFDKNTQEAISYNRAFDDVGGLFFAYPIAVTGNQLVSVLNPSNIDDYCSELDTISARLGVASDSNKAGLRTLLHDADGDPVLIKYQIQIKK